jgi:hypothetical protein
MHCTLFGIAVLWNRRGYRAGTDRQSFFLRLNQCANAVTVKLVLIEQFENLGYAERVVVKSKEHDTLGSLVGEADSDSRTVRGTYGTDYIPWSFAEVLHRNSIENYLGNGRDIIGPGSDGSQTFLQ